MLDCLTHLTLGKRASSLFFFKPPTRSRSPLLTGSRLISFPLATQMFQFAKFEKSKERRLATELGYGFPIGDPWITDVPMAFPSKGDHGKKELCESLRMRSKTLCRGQSRRRGNWCDSYWTQAKRKKRDVATEKVKVGRTLRNSSLNGWIMDFVKPFEKTRTEYYLQRNWDQYFSH